MRLSSDFTLEDFTRSQTADESRIRNSLNPRIPAHGQIISNLTALVKNVLQPLLDRAGPLKVTSGFRSRRLNQALGGSPTSQHLIGQAADIIPLDPAVSRLDLVEWARQDDLPFDQMICYLHQAHLHVSHRPHPRRELSFSPKQGQYHPVTVEELERLCSDRADG